MTKPSETNSQPPPKKFDFSRWGLQITPEKEARIREEQAEYARACNTPGVKSDAERRAQQGQDLERLHRANLDIQVVEREGAKNKAQYDLWISETKKKLADALALQGRYPEALALCQDEEQFDRYHRILEAIKRDDETRCDCEHHQANVKHLDGEEYSVSHTHEYISEHVISMAHGGRLMPMIICGKCGLANVREADGQLAHLEVLRRAAANAVHRANVILLEHHNRVVLHPDRWEPLYKWMSKESPSSSDG